MRIALRTGGGRGVYELAGSQGKLNASDLFDHEIFYELTPGIILPGRAIASRRSGKPRILLDEQKRTTHFYRLLAAVLLLPKPIREFKTTHGDELLKFEAYSMTAIKVDVGDPLLAVEQQLGISEAKQEPAPLTKPEQFTHQADFGIKDDVSPVEARLERVKQWRQFAVRGAAGEKFRKQVRSSYDFRCLFTGQRLPKTDETESAGVDAAHILPWSTHNINAVPNGICLNKLCHWAFDAGVVKLFFDSSVGAYVVQIPDKVRKAAGKVSFDLSYFAGFSGPIPATRLPKNPKLWPSPQYLDHLNKFVFNEKK